MRNLLILSLVAVAGSSFAIVTVVPNANAAVAGTTGLNTVIRDLGNPRTCQLMIDASQLSGLAGNGTITGLAFRLYGPIATAWTGGTWTDYEIRLGQGVGAGAMTTTLATNFVGGSTLVRDGALTMSGFSQVGSPTPFCNDIVFSTPYTYTGGALLIEIRHSGQTAAFPVVNTTYADAVASNATLGYNSMTATGQTATTGAAASFTITRLTAVPEPATMVALGLGAVAFIRRRRK